jgi:hypothetical protein
LCLTNANYMHDLGIIQCHLSEDALKHSKPPKKNEPLCYYGLHSGYYINKHPLLRLAMP